MREWYSNFLFLISPCKIEQDNPVGPKKIIISLVGNIKNLKDYLSQINKSSPRLILRNITSHVVNPIRYILKCENITTNNEFFEYIKKNKENYGRSYTGSNKSKKF